MRVPDCATNYISNYDMAPEERDILIGYIEQRNAIRPTAPTTRAKQGYIGCGIVTVLNGHGARLDTCTVQDLLKVAGEASSGRFTRNTRQTWIIMLKALGTYVHRFHHPIENLDLLTHDVRAGAASKNRKEALTLEEWDTVLNYPMPARDRAILALLYDGYHRPYEVLLLKWSDLKTNEQGAIEYEITFKTERSRTIVQKPGTTAILESWRRECGRKPDDAIPIFPTSGRDQYRSINVLKNLFDWLKEGTGIVKLKPSVLRTTAITHDVEAGLPISYICLRAWGEPYNNLINLYTKPDSARIQSDQHKKAGIKPMKILGSSDGFSVSKANVCRTCATINPPDKIFCMKCGQPLTEEAVRQISDTRSWLQNKEVYQELCAENERLKSRMDRLEEELLKR